LSARSGTSNTAVPEGRPFKNDDYGCGRFLDENDTLNNASSHEGKSPMTMESWAMRTSPSREFGGVLQNASTVVASSSTPYTRHDTILVSVCVRGNMDSIAICILRCAICILQKFLGNMDMDTSSKPFLF